jgi:peptidoglycan/xylan/chitin deacetylase (PgdA/CDA1 family)
MYHRVFDGAVGEYDITPDELRGELQYLYDNDYRPVRVIEIVAGHLNVPAGTTPFALTFDDASVEQMGYTEDGEIDPDSAVGILLAFAEEHPGFDPVASFYVNAGPFGGGSDGPDMLRELHELGFELGNHTAGHVNLRSLSDDGVRAELAAGVEVITDAVPDAQVRTLALPLGVWPEPRDLAYAGPGYEHEGILLVGSHPAPSPFHVDFDPLAIPRIRSTPIWPGGEPDFASGWWFTILEEHPERRYVSDGDPTRISFPRDLVDDLDERYSDVANPY